MGFYWNSCLIEKKGSTNSTLPSLQPPASMPTRSMNFLPACPSHRIPCTLFASSKPLCIGNAKLDFYLRKGATMMIGSLWWALVKSTKTWSSSVWWCTQAWMKPLITKVVLTMTTTGPIKHNWSHFLPSYVQRQQSRHSVAFTQWPPPPTSTALPSFRLSCMLRGDEDDKLTSGPIMCLLFLQYSDSQ